MAERYHQMVVYVPATHVEEVKAALFGGGAGRLGNYECCCWQTVGTGQFRPLAGSSPAIGCQGIVESVAEVKLEVICPEAALPAVIAGLRQAHPYETPAFMHWPVSLD
ncbi:MAG: NGG1p interacting factor NIF3 [Lentisphaeria bacterium]|jgi:hypothetical protein